MKLTEEHRNFRRRRGKIQTCQSRFFAHDSRVVASEISRDPRRSSELEGARATGDRLLLIMRCASDPSSTSCRVRVRHERSRSH